MTNSNVQCAIEYMQAMDAYITDYTHKNAQRFYRAKLAFVTEINGPDATIEFVCGITFNRMLHRVADDAGMSFEELGRKAFGDRFESAIYR